MALLQNEIWLFCTRDLHKGPQLVRPKKLQCCNNPSLYHTSEMGIFRRRKHGSFVKVTSITEHSWRSQASRQDKTHCVSRQTGKTRHTVGLSCQRKQSRFVELTSKRKAGQVEDAKQGCLVQGKMPLLL